ncbi:aminotransferase class V-fold PLP-dependent enzyme [Actinocrispum wychmicini]|uniref:Selenocysteine lyase/cysteine desulfurase n=1 Tax=Actinocrispum wychmicini TaxID=1213861 RepID=A0A4R2JJD0_9PSEU|nr:aminotransferase class V-fold PLP-dependent enzyme [Actinocrispum wychmicini]TCO56619.1 selenocysteine lyase/cysteine desulfurase [Actinocrispum wychmicini]
MIDLDAVRADTPGCRDLIFLDNAGSSLPPTPVLHEIQDHLRREAEIGGYRAAAERADDLRAGYDVLASLLACSPDEVAFTDSASRSWLAALDSLRLEPGDRALVTEVEYHSNALALLNLGVQIEPIPSDATGAVDVTALRDMLDSRVKLVSLVHVPTNGGLVNPVHEVAEAARSVGAVVVLDACQSLGQLPVSLESVHAVTASGRKWLRGPRGTGVLAVRGLSPRLIDGRAALWESADRFTVANNAKAFELWEYSVADRLGFIAAARYALSLGIAEIAAEVSARASMTRTLLSEIPGVSVCDLGAEQCGIVSFSVAGHEAEEVRDFLWDNGVAVSVTYDSSTLFDMTRRGLKKLVRASPHYFVSPDQIARFAEVLATL